VWKNKLNDVITPGLTRVKSDIKQQDVKLVKKHNNNYRLYNELKCGKGKGTPATGHQGP
jgi:hypothetical protein